MPIINQQSSILSEQELQLLAPRSSENQQATFKIYSYNFQIKLEDCQVQVAYSIEQLVLLLRASPRGVAVILPNSIASEPTINNLLQLLICRADIQVFWLGPLPSMETHLSFFIHSENQQQLKDNILMWKTRITRIFKMWLQQYPVAFITEAKNKHQTLLSKMGLQHVDYFNSHFALTELNTQKLLIIDIDNDTLHLVAILKHLSNIDQFPMIIIYGQLPTNVCRATYSLIKNYGFPILASLDTVPDKAQWDKLFVSLFSRVYLKHWVNDEVMITGAYPLYELESQSINSYFCLYGMDKESIALLPKPKGMRHIINARSLQEWFPDGIKRELRDQLAKELNCDINCIDLCIEHPESIPRTSLFFSILVMARLSKANVYWLVEDEHHLLSDILKSFPISEVILSEKLSNMLLTEPSNKLLDFLTQAQTEQVNIVASLQINRSAIEALALYGIESVLNTQCYIE